MSHPPDHIPDINNQSPAKVKSPKEKKEKKDKVSFRNFSFLTTQLYYSFNTTKYAAAMFFLLNKHN